MKIASPIPVLLTLAVLVPLALGGCRVLRYPAEKTLPDPIPDPPADVIEQVEQAALAQQEAAQDSSRVAEAVALGQSLVGQAKVVLDGQSWRSDCSGFVRGVLGTVGLDVVGPEDQGESGTELFYRAIDRIGGIHEDDLPEPGDLVFFSDTYDRNSNGRLDDEFTHVGMVESVSDDGTVRFLHYIGGAIRIGRMNLLRAHVHADEETGNILNDFLRRRRRGDSAKVKYLASELWIGFGRITGNE